MKKTALVLALLILSLSQAKAEQWQILGTRPMGMGGAFVALAQGPIAQYWNPAGLYQEKNVSGLEIPVGAGIEFTGNIMEDADKLGKLASDYSALQTDQTAGSAVNAKQMAAFVQSLPLLEGMNKNGKGALVEVAGGLNMKFSKIAVSVNNFTSLGASPFVDTVNIGLGSATGITGVDLTAPAKTDPAGQYIAARDTIDTAITTIGLTNIESLICGSAGCLTGDGINTTTQLANALVNQAVTDGVTAAQLTDATNQLAANAADAKPIIVGGASGNPYTNNTSNLTVKGGSFTEIAFGTARPVPVPGLTVGANLKLINGRIGYSKFNILQEESGTTDAFDDFTDNIKTTWQPAIDVGAIYELKNLYSKLPMNPRAGLVIRNINRPGFKNPEALGGKYHLDSQARMGIAINPTNFWNVALDMDLTRNITPVHGFKSRQLALGTEFNIINKKSFNIPLRLGVMKNVGNSGSKAAYTAGFGLNLLYMHLDVAGVMSSDDVTIDDKEYPTKAAVSASFGVLF